MIAIAIFAAGLAFGQPDQPTRIRPRGEPAQPNEFARDSEAEAQRVLIAYGLCVSRRNRRRVEAYLAAPVGSDEARRLASRIATSECLDTGELRFAQSLFRGALFNALYQIDYASRAPADLGAAPSPVQAADRAALSEQERTWRALSGFAECVVRAGPPEARQLVLSDVTTQQDRNAFASVQPHLGPCLLEGVELRFSRPMLRGIISESLYRLTLAVAPPVARTN